MLKDRNIYWIGGSPCSGKSTISEMIVKNFGFELYKCDDHLERYMEIGVKKGSEIMKKFKSMNLDQTWLRDVDEQVEDEFNFYIEALMTIKLDLVKKSEGSNIIVEGAAILPEFIVANEINKNNYICIVPTSEFQIDNYKKREWVNDYLKDCAEPQQAFENWMKRDIIYAETVKKEALKWGLNCISVDGSKSIEENYMMVKKLFKLV